MQFWSSVWLIFFREYWVKIRSKTFVYTTLLGPFIFLCISILPIGLQMHRSESKLSCLVLYPNKHIPWYQNWPNAADIRMVYLPISLNDALAWELDKKYDAIVVVDTCKMDSLSCNIWCNGMFSTCNTIKSAVFHELKEHWMTYKINQSSLSDGQKNILSKPLNWQNTAPTNTQLHTESVAALALIGSISIYLFQFLYGGKLMRSVLEEKTSRVIELLILSVKPQQILVGKIAGVLALALTQIAIWLVLGSFIGRFIYQHFQIQRFDSAHIAQTLTQLPDKYQALQIHAIVQPLELLSFSSFISLAILLFIGGYILYAAWFAAVASAVDTETDVQPFVLPITLPLLGAFLAANSIIDAPNGLLALVMSLFPLTAPVTLLLRFPFDIPVWQVVLSLLLLYLSAFIAFYASARVYKVAILIYGKRPTWKLIWHYFLKG